MPNDNDQTEPLRKKPQSKNIIIASFNGNQVVVGYNAVTDNK